MANAADRKAYITSMLKTLMLGTLFELDALSAPPSHPPPSPKPHTPPPTITHLWLLGPMTHCMHMREVHDMDARKPLAGCTVCKPQPPPTPPPPPPLPAHTHHL